MLSWATGDNSYPGSNSAFVVEIPNGLPPGLIAPLNNLNSNLFCSGHTFMANGKLFVTGGRSGPQTYGHPDVNIFDYQSPSPWQTAHGFPQAYSRWYASALSLADGGVLALAGNINGYANQNELPQVWENGGYRDLTSAVLKVANYSKIFVAPDGRVFQAGPAKVSTFLDTTGKGAWSGSLRHVFGIRNDGTAVLYDGKVLVIGGGKRGSVPSNSTELIDLNAATPAWALAAPMANPRRHANATLLSDGKTLVTGGSKSPDNNNAAGAIMATEMWDPATASWATMPNLTIPRIYHSAAILLPDGRVLVAGGSTPTNSPAATYKMRRFIRLVTFFEGHDRRSPRLPTRSTTGKPSRADA